MAKSSDSPQVESLLTEADWLRRLARYLAHDRADADDLAQETWMTAIRSPAPAARASMRPWLARVLRNVRRMSARGTARRRARETDASRLDAGEETTSTEAILSRLELQRMVSAMVRDLEEPYRTVLLLRFFEGTDLAEIARQQGIPAGTVRWRLNEALRRLRLRLDDAHGGARDAWKAILAVPLTSPAVKTPSVSAGAPGGGRFVAGSRLRPISWLLPAALATGLVCSLAHWSRVDRDNKATATPGPMNETTINPAEVTDMKTSMTTLFGVVLPALVAGADASMSQAALGQESPAATAACVPANDAGCIERISRAQLPPAVEAALAGATIGRTVPKLAIEPRLRNGHLTYNIAFSVNGAREELDFVADGTFLQYQAEVALDDLPAVISEAAKTALPDGVAFKAELHNEGGLSFRDLEAGIAGAPVRFRPAHTFYEVQVHGADGDYKVHIGQDGKVLKTRPK